MIKILRISNHPSENKHGVGLHPSIISNNYEFETTFVCPSLNNNDNYLEPENYKLVPSKVKFEKRPTNVTLLKEVFFHFKRIYKLSVFSFFSIRVARKNKVDLVHIHSPMYLMVLVWGKLFGKLTCITYHGTDYLRIKDSKIYNFLSKHFIDIGFCISPHMLNKMKNNHNEVIYVPNGINTNFFYNRKEKREKIILAVGSLKKEKSYNNLIKAFKDISKFDKDFELHIAGDGDLKSDLELLVQEEKLDKKVIFCGNLKLTELVDKYNSAECFILSSYTEGFPKVVLEAVFCGCKVVATDVGSVKTLLPDKYLIPNDSVNNLIKYMKKIIHEDNYHIDKEKLKSIYTWPNVIDKYKKTYEINLK